MDSLHQVIRAIRRESKGRPDPVSVFREFLGHLERLGRRGAKKPQTRQAKTERSRKR